MNDREDIQEVNIEDEKNYKRPNNSKRMIAIGLSIALIVVMSAGSAFFGKNESAKTPDYISQFGKAALEEKIIRAGGSDKILVIRAKGTIAPSDNSMLVTPGIMDIDGVIKNLDRAIKDNSIKGVILEVDSPGGTVYHSEMMRQKILEYKATEKPIYTSMGLVAASGGYYISAPTDKIFASEETITGSIGVISRYTNLEGLYDKLGIKFNTFTSGDFKDMGAENRDMREDEREYAQSIVNEFYEGFVKIVADGRGMNEQRVRNLADGRTYTGRNAHDNGLVDEIGYFDHALDQMIEDLGLNNPTVLEYRTESNYINTILGDFIKINHDNFLEEIKIEDAPLFLYKGGF